MGGGQRDLTAANFTLLTNREVLAVQEESAANAPVPCVGPNPGGHNIAWTAVSTEEVPTRYLALFNVGPAQEDSPIAVLFSDLNLTSAKSCAVRDLWGQKDIGRMSGTIHTVLSGCNDSGNHTCAAMLAISDCK
jgi:hypothetical protein